MNNEDYTGAMFVYTYRNSITGKIDFLGYMVVTEKVVFASAPSRWNFRVFKHYTDDVTEFYWSTVSETWLRAHSALGQDSHNRWVLAVPGIKQRVQEK